MTQIGNMIISDGETRRNSVIIAGWLIMKNLKKVIKKQRKCEKLGATDYMPV
jgi:hypothetical protein